MARVTARFMVDKNALARMRHPPVRGRLAPIIESGEAATCAIVDLEVLFSARNHEEYETIRERRLLTYARVPLTQQVFDRAIEVQGMLARLGRHRLPIPDLIIAAAAEANDLTILHYDADFDQIAKVTKQPTQWVVPRARL